MTTTKTCHDRPISSTYHKWILVFEDKPQKDKDGDVFINCRYRCSGCGIEKTRQLYPNLLADVFSLPRSK